MQPDRIAEGRQNARYGAQLFLSRQRSAAFSRRIEAHCETRQRLAREQDTALLALVILSSPPSQKPNPRGIRSINGCKSASGTMPARTAADCAMFSAPGSPD